MKYTKINLNDKIKNGHIYVYMTEHKPSEKEVDELATNFVLKYTEIFKMFKKASAKQKTQLIKQLLKLHYFFDEGCYKTYTKIEMHIIYQGRVGYEDELKRVLDFGNLSDEDRKIMIKNFNDQKEKIKTLEILKTMERNNNAIKQLLHSAILGLIEIGKTL